MCKRILLSVLIGFSVVQTMAQRPLSVNTISSVNTNTGKIYYANRNEPPRAIEFNERTVAATNFLTNVNYYLNIPAEFTFTEVESNTDHLGMRHRLLQQYYKGIPLEGMHYRVHEKNGFITSANGKAVQNIKRDMRATIGEEQAFYLATKYLNTKDTIFRQGKKLIVSKGFTFTPESFAIAFQFDIDVSLIERWRISIDASNGEVINKVSLVNSCFGESRPPLPYDTGTGTTNYYGKKTIRVEKLGEGSRLKGQTENGGIIHTLDFAHEHILALIFGFYDVYDFYSSDNTYHDPYKKSAVAVQWAAEQAYEYYFKNHDRNSFDNQGATITSYVHVHRDFDNAFWNGKILAFGDGSNNNPLVELDVVSHELTHGVTQYEAGLQYYYEPGALNESFSDILGKAVEFYTFRDTATWQLAKHFRDGGLRDLSNPNLKNQPDTYLGNMWHTGYEDNGGVHYNSGVQNFWFYLLCEGGSGVNDNEASYSINAIGIDAAAKIAYRNLTEYLGYYSDYLDSRIGSLLATADLYGKNSTEYWEVDKAWDAVGVIDEPIITGFELYDITATTVKIKGSLLPRGDTVTYHFEYGTTAAFGNSSAVYKYTDTVEGILRGLQSETKYYVRLVATNENGSTYAATEFTTITLAPLVKIRQTVDVTETAATLHGQINPNSLPTSFYFKYGSTPALGLVTSTYPLSDTTEFLDVSAPVIDLQPRQTYYYRLVASNGFSSSETESLSFFTAVKPVINDYTPATAPIGAEVIITGQNFNSTKEANLVSFGATRAKVLSATSTQIKVKVPAGASLGPISLLDAESGLATESVREFVPTFTGNFDKGSLHLTVGLNDPYIYRAMVQDMDGDSKPDIVTAHAQGFSVFQNVHQGGDISEQSFIRNTFPREYNSGEIYVIDFDGNGLKDVALRDQIGLKIYPNFSVPGFIFFQPPVELPVGYLSDIIFNDFDHDGRIDVAGINYPPEGGRRLTIFRNENPRGSILSENLVERFSIPLPYYAYTLYTDDFNNDGKVDIMVGVLDQNFMAILENDSQPGAFNFREIIVADSNKGRFPGYAFQDFNEDGWKDIASRSPYEIGRLVILENTATSADIISIANPIVIPDQYNGSAMQPGDINGDGKVDLLLATRNRNLILVKNNTVAGASFSELSFEKFEEYGQKLPDSETGSIESSMAINDLNGDGRPEVIRTNGYSYYPRDGYLLEIWQNLAEVNCLDPSLVSVTASNYSATIALPPNTTIDQFEIDYTQKGYNYWNRVESTTISLWSGYSYQLRVRAKCYLSFTEYHYIEFTTDCVDASSFSVTNIGINAATVTVYDIGSFEVEYSPADENQWISLPQYISQITNLLPGTKYDLRFRGRWCNSEFKYKQFTTLCPALSTLDVTDLVYNKAVVNWTSNYTGSAILEYSPDNVNWTLIDETRTMFPLIPTKQYFVRGRFACTDATADFMYTSFITPCPTVSTISFDVITPFSATVNWVDESATGRYVVTYGIDPGGAITTRETGSTSFRLDGLSPGTKYRVAVAPQCTQSKIFTSATFSTVCYVPFGLTANDITYTTAELSWNDDFSGVPYSIDYSIAGSNVWHTKKTLLTEISLTDLRPGTVYQARVHINCLSETARYVSLNFETGLYEETYFAPNPTDSKITIYPSKNLIGNYFSIYDNTGRIMIEGELLDYTFDLSNFSRGIYTLKIEGEKLIKIVKR